MNAWRLRQAELAKDEPPSLSSLDYFYGHGADEPDESDVDAALRERIELARKKGASPQFIARLRVMVLKKYRPIFALQIGKKPPCLCHPVKLDFDESLWKWNTRVRQYSHDQQKFLDETIPKMIKSGLLVHHNTRSCGAAFIPRKKSGKFRLCVDMRLNNIWRELTRGDPGQYVPATSRSILGYPHTSWYSFLSSLCAGFKNLESQATTPI